MESQNQQHYYQRKDRATYRMTKYTDQKKKPDESFSDYKKRVLDTKSNSFCGAKWYYSTIWLGSGMTTSCHHPLPHRVSEEEVIKNYKSLANTSIRKKERLEMQKGIRCEGCDYCWRVEDLGNDKISDRVYKSVLYSEHDLQTAYNSSPDEDFDLKYLEISFDRTCNLACSYCNPAFSTTWVKDIKTNGPYTDLKSDAQDHYGHPHDGAGKHDHNDDNPYVNAFFKWWDNELNQTLTHLRLTGGEPLMSKHTWKLFEWFEKNKKDDLYFAINSNLVCKKSLVEKMLDASKNIGDFNVYTSCESTTQKAEYVRDGFDWNIWTDNFDLLAKNNVKLHSMCTIGAIGLSGLVDYLDWCLEQKKTYGRDTPTFTLNIQRFPKFQSPLILPQQLRNHYADSLNNWKEKADRNLLHDMEVEHLDRLIDYLKNENNQLGNQDYLNLLRKDFKNYYTQFDSRRGKNFTETFADLADWYCSL